MDAAAKIGGIPSVSIIFSLSMEISRLTRDGTAEPVSRDQTLRHEGGKGIFISHVQLTTSRIDNLTRLIHNLRYVMTIHTWLPIRTVRDLLDRTRRSRCIQIFL